MKAPIRIDYGTETITLNVSFAKKASNPSTQEYVELCRIRSAYPEYKLIVRSIARNSTKKVYAGLTYDYMRDYILTHAENPDALYEEFEEKILISKCHSKAFRYPVIKKWFLEQFPEIKNFGISHLSEETTALASSTLLTIENNDVSSSTNAA